MTYLQRRDHQRQKIAVWHTLWELGQARAALRRMGEVLPEPAARSREAFADAIYNLTDRDERPSNLRVLPGLGQEGSGPDDQRAIPRSIRFSPTTAPSSLVGGPQDQPVVWDVPDHEVRAQFQVLDGGLGDSPVSSGGIGPEASHRSAAVGRKPPSVPAMEQSGQATNFEREDQ